MSPDSVIYEVYRTFYQYCIFYFIAFSLWFAFRVMTRCDVCRAELFRAQTHSPKQHTMTYVSVGYFYAFSIFTVCPSAKHMPGG
jgi:hypothetical protein